MRRSLCFIVVVCAGVAAAPPDLAPIVNSELPALLATYKELHEHPELSGHEERTSAFIAGELRKAGYDVTDHIGHYSDGTPAFGVVAIMRNGNGPRLLIRTELDALPVTENTGLPYASREPGKMHACGHDVHMTSLLGTARALARLKDRWHGTVMFIGQPAEENIGGAQAMLNDHVYERFGKPDYAIALHDDSGIATGKVGVVSGPLLAGATSVDVTMRGVGGHGAHPEATKDPVVMAAELILALQTIVSRQIRPLDPAVVTVGSIHGGTRPNIIPDEVKLQLSTRFFNEDVRRIILDGIRKTANGIALAAGVPADRAPIVNVLEAESVPPTYNDPALAARLKTVFVNLLGADNVLSPDPQMASEDFGLFGLQGRQIPVFMFLLGAVDPAKLEESHRTGKPLPSLHSSLFYPVPEPTIRTGVTAMTAAALNLLQ